jgi:hypothetical protein
LIGSLSTGGTLRRRDLARTSARTEFELLLFVLPVVVEFALLLLLLPLTAAAARRRLALLTNVPEKVEDSWIFSNSLELEKQ